ncbi:uncharacterized protein tmem79a isoform X1 [Nelusetta ayraudi]|uniref:uncharacterized protein tmem79a isoform X1 n=1 Tax=Nelusetta ayraudi TaxID=303726 RepID=UPI003F714F2E
MSDQGGLSSEQVSLLPACPLEAAAKQGQHKNSTEEESEIRDEGRGEEEEEEVASSAHLEPSTLPWPGDKDGRPQTDAWSVEKHVVEAGDEDVAGFPEEEGARKSRSRWRESMPEGERWRDDELDVQHQGRGDGSLADDEDEGDDEEEEEEEEEKWMSEKAARGFTPEVTIVRPSCKVQPEERRPFIRPDEMQLDLDTPPPPPFYQQYPEEDDKYYVCEDLCANRIKLILATAAAGVIFPLLVWGGYALLPFDTPLLQSAPLRVVYTLRCTFFAAIPILLGMVVLGLARLRHGNVRALYEAEQVDRDVAVHWHFVNQSLSLFLFFFLQLAVMATYVDQDLVKLVPLLTICFSFGRLIYWLCLFLGSTSIRAFGFGLSFHPILVMLGVNLYYVCSSMGQSAVFDVAPPTTAPPAARNWWG